MRRVVQWMIICAVVVAPLWLAAPSLAQGDDLVVAAYTVGSKQMIVAHPRNPERFRGDPEVLHTALTRAEAVYERLFGPTRMKIFARFVSFQHPAGADVLAMAGKQSVDVPVVGSNRTNPETVCLITIYNVPDNGVPAALSITAVHELVHCYQGFNMREGAPRLDIPTREWWSEGTAEWLAQKVYPEFDGAPDVGNWQAKFVSNVGESLLNGNYSYDAMYFWHALEQHTNVTRAMELLKQMLREPDSGAEVLERFPDINGVFATFGKLMAHNAIPYQPDASRLYKPEYTQLVEALPFRFSLASDTFTFTPYYVKIAVPNVRGISVKITGQTASDYTVYSPYTLDVVPDGGAISLCGVTEFALIVSRGKFRLDGGAPPSVEITGFDCTPEAPPPPCLVGRWKLASWPSITRPSDGEVVSYGSSGMEITPIGKFTFRIDGLRVQVGAPEDRKVQLRIDSMIYTGRVTFADLGRGRYKPASGVAELIGRPYATMQVSGVPRVNDISESLQRFLPASGRIGEGNVVFICTGANTMEYQITVSGQTVTYRFTK